tara:strand:+ start:2453 stop:4018 length:1566 start_codon:yes stop_codon:yes gene_type:complete
MARVHRLSKENKAHAVLTCAECTVREADMDFKDESTDGPLIDECLQSFFSKLKYLKKQAASEHSWSPTFLRMLNSAHSIRQRRVDFDKKETLRTRKMRCMACGQWESHCAYTLDILGPFDHSSWFGASANIQKTWQHFLKDYASLRESPLDALPNGDYGSFALGATCLRRAVLFHQINTLFMERVWSAYEEVREYEMSEGKIHDALLLTVEDEDVTDFCETLTHLELCCADDKRTPPVLLVDEGMWERIDEARAVASDANPEKEADVLRRRSWETLNRFDDQSADSPRSSDAPSNSSSSKGKDCKKNTCHDDVEWSDEDDEKPKHRGRHNKRTGGVQGRAESCRRACVVMSDESDHENRESSDSPQRERAEQSGAQRLKGDMEQVQDVNLDPGGSSEQHRGRKRTRAVGAPAAVTDSEYGVNDDPDQEDVEPRESEEAAADIERAVRPQPQSSQRMSSVEIAREHRIPGLPSDRNALYRLMTLQVQLMREGRDEQAAVCTENIMCIQRLLARVEELRHSVS